MSSRRSRRLPRRIPSGSRCRRALLGLAEALTNGDLTLDTGSDRGEARRRLLELPGIGPWTTEYIAMRAMRDPDAFLPSDLAYALQHLWATLHPPRQAKGTKGAIQKSNTTTPKSDAERLAA